MKKQTVWLVGMMGAGKSTVGRIVARQLDRPFVDTDAEVERAAGRSIAEIFAGEGEPAFRGREREAVEAVCGREAVVALGGGAMAQPGARERLAGSGIVVYLRSRPETLLARLGPSAGRPLLGEGGAGERLERLRDLLGDREPAYQTASLIVDTDDARPEEVAETVARRIREQWEAGPR